MNSSSLSFLLSSSGKVVENFDLLDASNSSCWRFAETFFTSFRYCKGTIAFEKDHQDRLKKSMGHFFGESFIEVVDKVWQGCKGQLKKNPIDNGRCRLTFFPIKEEETLCSKIKDFMAFVECSPIDSASFHSFRGEQPLVLKTFIRKESFYPEPEIKLPFYLTTARELRQLDKNLFDDILFLDPHKLILESSSSNILFIKDKKIFIPQKKNMILQGIGLKNIILAVQRHGYIIEKNELNFNDIDESFSAFLVNSVRGLRLVGKIDNLELSLDCNEFIDVFLNEFELGSI